MNDKLDKLINVLKELRSACINSDITTIENIIHKYDLLFMGSKFNTINSIELRHSLKECFNLSFSAKELNELIPEACKRLNMTTEILIPIDKINSHSIEDVVYHISLF